MMSQSCCGDRLDVAGYSLVVKAVAGVESCCYVESLDVAFDMGCCLSKVWTKSHVFITHGHIDHIGAIAIHAARRHLYNLKPAKYYAPASLIPTLQRIINEFSVMQEEAIPAELIALKPSDEVQIAPRWLVRAYKTCHRVESQGYVLYRTRSSLREDLKGKSSVEIAALKKQGIQVTEERKVPEIAYTGDTTFDIFDRSDELKTADLLRVRVLVTEATFIGDRTSVEHAVEGGHCHLSQFMQSEGIFRDVERIVFLHFSARYSSTQIVQELRSFSPQFRKRICTTFDQGEVELGVEGTTSRSEIHT